MIYSLTVTTPANTTLASPLVSDLKVTKGMVFKVVFDFPAGSAGLLRCWVKDGGYHVWPTNPSETFRGDGILISFDDSYLINSEPYIFQINTANLDDTYSHDISIHIGLVSRDIYIARYLPSYGYQELRRIIDDSYNRQLREQERIRQEALLDLFPI